MTKKTYFKYDNHASEWDKVLNDPDQMKMGETWFKTDTLDSWRHERMRSPMKVVVQYNNEDSWLTVGDGRYGTDAHYLMSVGAKNVHCSDISDTLLKIGSERGFINSFSAENAESLNFADRSFDYVHCKEAFHHFPRPYMALYEMFRVAKKAVFLTEPRDQSFDRGALASIIYGLKKILLRKKDSPPTFEPVGNFVFSISEKELEKFLLGMHYTYVGYAGCNDEYIEGVEYAPLNSAMPEHRKMQARILKKIRKMDLYCKFGFAKTGVLTAALFKDEPAPELLRAMIHAGWTIKRLAKNPYLSQANIQ